MMMKKLMQTLETEANEAHRIYRWPAGISFPFDVGAPLTHCLHRIISIVVDKLLSVMLYHTIGSFCRLCAFFIFIPC